MNILQKLKSPETFCVTINDPGLVDESKIIKKINYEHPLFTNESVSAQKKIKEINSNSRILFCGAYCGYGFHEDGLKSALDVWILANTGVSATADPLVHWIEPQLTFLKHNNHY